MRCADREEGTKTGDGGRSMQGKQAGRATAARHRLASQKERDIKAQRKQRAGRQGGVGTHSPT